MSDVPIDPKEPYILWEARTLEEKVERLRRVHDHNALEQDALSKKLADMVKRIEKLEERAKE